MELILSTPALLFPAISLLLPAYTNRFLAMALVIRDRHAQIDDSQQELIEKIRSLRHRASLIRAMQGISVVSLLSCVLCMFMLFAGWGLAG